MSKRALLASLTLVSLLTNHIPPHLLVYEALKAPEIALANCQDQDLRTSGRGGSQVSVTAACDGHVRVSLYADNGLGSIQKVEGGTQHIAICDDEGVRAWCSSGQCCGGSASDNGALMCDRDGNFLASVRAENGQYCPPNGTFAHRIAVRQGDVISVMQTFDGPASRLVFEAGAQQAPVDPTGGECADGTDNDRDGGVDALVNLSSNNGERFVLQYEARHDRSTVVPFNLLNQVQEHIRDNNLNYNLPTAPFLHSTHGGGGGNRWNVGTLHDPTLTELCNIFGFRDYDVSAMSTTTACHDGEKCNYHSPDRPNFDANPLNQWDGSRFVTIRSGQPGRPSNGKYEKTWVSRLECVHRLPACSDGIDNDGQGGVDMADDGCDNPDDDSEEPHDDQCTDPSDPSESAEVDVGVIATIAPRDGLKNTIVNYRLNVFNNGPEDANNVVVTNTIESGLRFVTDQSDSRCSVRGNVITCDGFDLRDGRDTDIDIALEIEDAVNCGHTYTQNISTDADEDDRNSSNDSTSIQTRTTCVECNNGANDDFDTFTDFIGGDPGCTGPTDPTETNPNVECDDGLNNDPQHDNDIDFPADNECDSAIDMDEDPEEADVQVTLSTVTNAPRDGRQTYSMLLENLGRAVATNVVGTVRIPSGVTFDAAATSSNCSQEGSNVVCRHPMPLQPNANGVTYDVHFTVGSSVACGSDLRSHATVLANETDPDLTNNRSPRGSASLQTAVTCVECNDDRDNDGDGLNNHGNDPGCESPLDPTETNPDVECDDGLNNDGAPDGADFGRDPDCESPTDNDESSADLEIIQIEAPTSIQPRDKLQYRITVRNNGFNNAENPVFTFAKPQGFSLSATGNSAICQDIGNDTIECTRTRINANDTGLYQIAFDVPEDHPCNPRDGSRNTIDVSFSISADTTDPNNQNNDGTASTAVSCRAICDNGFDDDGDGFVDFGTGPLNDPGCDSDTDSTETNPNVECDDGINNDNHEGADFGRDSDCDSPTDNNESSADIAVGITGPQEINRDLTEVFTINIVNNGANEATDVEATLPIPAGLSFDAGSSHRDCQELGNTVVCGRNANLTLQNGAVHPYNVGLTVSRSIPCNDNSRSLQASVTTTEDDPNLQNNDSNILNLTTRCTECNNGVDDDGDQHIDADGNPADPGCIDSQDPTETNPDVECDDGDDNDGDGDVDAADAHCDDPTDDDESAADVEITLTAPKNVLPGEKYTEQIRIFNHGFNEARDVALLHEVPSGLEYVDRDSTPNCGTNNDGDVICVTPRLAKDADVNYDIVFAVPANASCGTNVNIQSQASVSTSSDDPNAANDQANAQINVACPPTAALDITLSAVPEIRHGNVLLYTATVTNNGPDTATNVVITDDNIPADFAFVQADSSSECQKPGADVICTLPQALANGASATVTIAYTTPINSPCNDPIDNDVSVTATEEQSDDTSNTVRTLLTCYACEDGIDNDGDGAVDEAGGDFSCLNDPHNDDEEFPKAECQDNIDNGDGDGLIDFGNGPRNDPGCDSKQDNDEFNLPLSTDLTISKTGPSSISQGETLRFTLTADNNGTIDANNVTMYDLVPAGLRFNQAESDPSCRIQTQFQAVFASSVKHDGDFGGLSGADSFCQQRANAAGLPGSWVAVMSDSTDNARDRINLHHPLINMNGEVVALSNADLWDGSIYNRIQYDEFGQRSPGLVYTGTEANGLADTATAGNSTICDDWSSDATNRSSEAGRTDSTNDRWISIHGDTTASTTGCMNNLRVYCASESPVGIANLPEVIACDAGTLSPGGQATADIAFDVATDHACDGSADIRNTAILGSTTPNATPANSVTSASPVAVDCRVPEVDLEITKSAVQSIYRDNTLLYTITVTNLPHATDEATSIVIRDPVPHADITLNTTVTSAGCTEEQNGTDILCNGFSLLPGESQTVTIAYDIPNTFACRQPALRNTATVTALENDSDTSNNTSQEVVTTVECHLCEDGLDNDGDGATDLDDFSCQGDEDRDNETTPEAECQDTIDNSDQDGLIDFGTGPRNDPGCDSLQDNNEGDDPVTLDDVTVTKTGPQTIIRGTTIVYDIVIENTGNTAISDVLVSDQKPTGLTFNVGASTPGCQDLGAHIACSFDLPAQSGPITTQIAFDVPVDTVCGATIRNTATVSAFGTTQTITTNPAVNTTISCPVTSTDLALAKTGPSSITQGETLTYDLTVTNNGTIDAENVTTYDVVPTGLQFNSAESDPSCRIQTHFQAIFASAQKHDGDFGGLSGADSFCQAQANAASLPGAWIAVMSDSTTDARDRLTLHHPLINMNGDIIALNNDDLWDGDIFHEIGYDERGRSVRGIVYTGTESNGVADTATATNSTICNDWTTDSTTKSAEIGRVEKKNGHWISIYEGRESSTSACVGQARVYCASTSAVGIANLPEVIACDAGDVAASDSVSTSVAFNVPSNHACGAGNTIDNTAFASSSTAETNAANNSVSASPVSVDCSGPTLSADLSLVKNGPATVTVGETVTFELDVASAGPDPVRAMIVDTPPANFSFNAGNSDTRCTEQSGEIHCTNIALDDGDTETIRVAFDVPSDHACGSTYTETNTATIAHIWHESDESDNTDSATLHVLCERQLVDLALDDITQPTSVVQGDTVVIPVTARNFGPRETHLYGVFYPIPSGFEFNSSQSSSPCEVVDGDVRCQGRNFDVGNSESFTIAFDTATAPQCDTSISTDVTVISMFPDTNQANNVKTHTLGISCPVAGPTDLEVSLTGPQTANPGAAISYDATVTNNGPEIAIAPIVINMPIPSSDLTLNTTATDTECQEVNGVIECTRTTNLAVNDTESFTIVFTLRNEQTALRPAGLLIEKAYAANTDPLCTASFTATATAPVLPQGDTNDVNNSASVTTNVVCTDLPADLEIIKTGPATVVRGQPLRYELQVINHGPGTANNIVAADTTPDNLTYIDEQGDACVLDNARVLCDNLNLPSGMDHTYEVSFDTSNTACGEIISNHATVSTSSTDPDSSNNTSPEIETTVTCPVGQPILSIEKTDNEITAAPGDTLTYDITITNSGTADAIDVIVEDVLPGYTNFISATDGGIHVANNNHVLWDSQFDIPANSSKTIHVTAQVDASAPDLTPLNNVVTLLDGTEATDLTTVRTTGGGGDDIADLSITKAGPQTVNGGDTLVYNVTVINNDIDTTAKDVFAIDTIPSADLIFDQTNSDPLCRQEGADILCGSVELAPGEAKDFLIAFEVPLSLCHADLINEAIVSTSSTDPDSSNNRSGTITTNVQCTSGVISVSKTDNVDTIHAGQNLTYEISLTNNDTTDAVVDVLDVLPSYVTYVSSTDNGAVLSNGVVTWVGVDVPANSDKTLEVVVTVESDTPDQTELRNIVFANGVRAEDTTTVTGVTPGSADLELVSKTGPSHVTRGGAHVDYVITVVNNGPDTAQNITVTDVVPTGLEFVSSPDACTESNGTVTCTASSLAPHTPLIFTITMRAPSVDPCTQSSITNIAVVSSTTNDPDGSNNTSDPVTTILQCADAAFTISKTDNLDIVHPGDTLTYSITVTNTSNNDATNVRIQDSLPEYLSVVSISDNGVLALPSGSQVSTSGFVEWTVDIPANQSNIVTVTATVSSNAPTPFVLVNEATVDGIVATDTTTIQAVTGDTADVSIIKTGPQTINRGETLHYTIIAANLGPSTAHSVEVTDAIPAGLSFNLGESTSGCTQPQGTNNVVCALGSMNAGVSQTLTIAMDIPAHISCGYIVQNDASISTTTTDPNASNNDSQTVSTTVECPSASFTISKTDGQSTAAAGDVLTYNITVTNATSNIAQNVTVTDSLPGGMTYLTSSDNGVHDNGVVTWNLASLAANASETLTVSARVSDTASNGTVLTNTAIVDGQTATDSTTVQGGTTGGDNFTLVLRDSRDPVDADDDFNYTVTLTNLTSTAITNLPVRLNVDSDTDVRSATDGGSVSTHQVNWTNVTIPANGSKTLHATVRVDDNVDDNDILRATATAGSKSDDEDTRVDTDGGSSDDLTISISDSPDPVRIGDIISYNIRICNEDNTNLETDVEAELDSDTSFISATDDGDEESDDEVRWEDLDIRRDSCETLRLRVRVRNSATDGDSLRLRVRVEDEEDTERTRVIDHGGPLIPGGPLDPGGPILGTPGRVSVDKSVGIRDVRPGSTVTYTVRIQNTGTQTMKDIKVIDSYTAGSFQVIDAAGGNVSGNQITWPIPILGPNALRVISYRVRVDQGMRHGQRIKNTVMLQGPDLSGQPSDEVEITVISQLPQTGNASFVQSALASSQHIRPAKRDIVGANASDTLPFIIWTNIIAIGIAGGWIAGRRFF